MTPSGELRKRIQRLIGLPVSEALAELQALRQEPGIAAQQSVFGRTINALEIGLPQVRLLGGCTLDYLAPSLAAELCLQNVPFRVSVGGYDQVLQDLESQVERYAVLVPWRNFVQDIEAELAFWKSCWQIALRKGIRCVQVSYDWVRPDSTGHRCEQISVLGELNRRLRQDLPQGNFFLELGLLSGMMGRREFYDSRGYYWTKQPFSSAGLEALSRELAAALRTLVIGPKKVLVVDLDNTIWGGEVGEVGIYGIELDGAEGEAYLAFQRYLKSLQEQGVLLAIASKNEESVVLEAFAKNSHLLLGSEDFVAREIHWEPKSQSLVRIATKLNLSLDSFVFFDDNPRERMEVSDALPEVEVIDVSRDPADYIDDLQRGRFFETITVTQADRSRTEQYRQEVERSQVVGSLEEHLTGLAMTSEIEALSEQNLGRMVQLLARTNQFNLTTRRHGPEELQRLSDLEGSYCRCLRLSDKFGDLGVISVLIAIPLNAESLKIESWVMSCRALQRTVEFHFFDDLMSYAKEAGFHTVLGEFLPTSKNVPVSTLYARLGFSDQGGGLFKLELESYRPRITYVG